MPTKKSAPASDLPKLAAPAQRAVKGAGVDSLAKLARFSETEVMALHGMGPNAMKALKAALKQAGLGFGKTR